jgi:Zn-dependent protease
LLALDPHDKISMLAKDPDIRACRVVAMRDPLTWSFPLVRLFGISVRVHILFLVIAVGLVLRAYFKEGMPADAWKIAFGLMGLLFLSVLLHEFGHCFGARSVDGDAHEILLWPLGGLAYVEVPHTPRANFIATLAGPLVNILLCLGAGAALSYYLVRPPFSPWWDVYGRELASWDGSVSAARASWLVWLARFFWLNWVLVLLNLLLVGFPMDGGRLFQCALWPRFGFRQATLYALLAGFVTTLVVFIYAIAKEDVLFGGLGLFIGLTCWQQWFILERGGEDSLFGYDFSQGFTSLERDLPPRRRRPGFWQRWRQNRAAAKLQRQQEQREAEERRMDELLEKVQRQGLHALTDEERRFLTRVSAKYRNRQ